MASILARASAWNPVTIAADDAPEAIPPLDQVSELLIREEAALRRAISRYVRHSAAVDEIFQEVSLKVLRRLDSVRDPLALRGWLFQLARNACLDHLRAQDRRPANRSDQLEYQDAGGDLGRNPVERVMEGERISAVHKALAELPDSQRQVIQLRISEGLDHEAIAARLGISRQAVEVRLCRGRQQLKQRLEAILQGDL